MLEPLTRRRRAPDLVRVRLLPALLAAAAGVAMLGCGGARPAARPPIAAPVAAIDLVLVGGKVFTADPARPWAEAVAVRGDRIVAVGSTAEIRALPGTSATTRVIELGGRVVIPGINDAHLHVPDVWQPHEVRIAAEDPTLDDLVAAAKQAATEQPAGTWLSLRIGSGLYDDPRATRDALDKVTPRHPVWTHDQAGHAKLVNTAALVALGISETEPDPPHGRYGRDPKTRRLTGWLHESPNWRGIRRLEEAMDDATIAGAAAKLEQRAFRFGITSIQTMPTVTGERLARVLATQAPKLRWRIIHWPHGEVAQTFARGPASDRVRIDGVKYVLDGTPIERSAWKTEPYRDRPDHRGALSFTTDEVRRMLTVADSSGEQLLVHAVGDATIEALLATMEQLAPAERWRTHRIRIEHGDLLTPAQIRRAAALGVVVVQNPVHFLLPALLAKRLGDCGGTCQPLKSLAGAGVALAFGSDGPLNPYLGIMAATLHPTSPSEALTREEAITAYTHGAAFAERTEHDKGRLAAGLQADLAVLTQDVFVVPPDQLPATEAWMTIVGGEIVYAASAEGQAATSPAAP